MSKYNVELDLETEKLTRDFAFILQSLLLIGAAMSLKGVSRKSGRAL